jgi:hypothetical protein
MPEHRRRGASVPRAGPDQAALVRVDHRLHAIA